MKNSHRKIILHLSLALVLIALLWFLVIRGLAAYTHHSEKIPVPNLYGLQLDEVSNLLDEAGLRYEVRDSAYQEGFPGNAVLGQDPDTGEFVKRNRIIYLSVNSKDIPKVRMPDLIDKNINQVIMILEGIGLKVGRIDTTSNITEDAVLEQRYKGKGIRPDTEIPQGSTIDVVIGDGGPTNYSSEMVEIPDLIGNTLEESRYILEASGLILGEVSAQGQIKDSAQATIITQIPSYTPGGRAPRGSSVSIIIQE